MTISVDCAGCGRHYDLRDDAGGKKIRCKDCREVIAVPEAPEIEDWDDDWGGGGDDWGGGGGGGNSYAMAPPPASGYGVESPAPAKKKTRRKRRSSSNAGKTAGKIGGIVLGLLVLLGVALKAARLVGRLDLDFGSASYDWQEFQAPGTSFSVEMPDKPTQGPPQFQAGLTVTTWQVTRRSPEHGFGLIYLNMNLGPNDAYDLEEGLRGAKQGMLARMNGGRLTNERRFNVTDPGGNSHPAMELTVEAVEKGTPIVATYRIYIIGSYVVTTFTGAEQDEAAGLQQDFNRYLDSFKITSAVTPVHLINGGGMQANRGGGAPGGFNPNPGFDPAMNPAMDPAGIPPTNPPGGFNQNPGGFAGNPGGFNPGTDARRIHEENMARMRRMQEESRQRMEQMRRDSQRRIEEMRNRTRRPGGFP